MEMHPFFTELCFMGGRVLIDKNISGGDPKKADKRTCFLQPGTWQFSRDFGVSGRLLTKTSDDGKVKRDVIYVREMQ